MTFNKIIDLCPSRPIGCGDSQVLECNQWKNFSLLSARYTAPLPQMITKEPVAGPGLGWGPEDAPRSFWCPALCMKPFTPAWSQA